MGKFSKIFKHIESKDLRNKYEQKKVAKIEEENKKEDTKKYISSAMEQVKYNWRSKIDVGETIREAMTTSDVATISTPANPDEVLNDTPLDNADDFAPGARGDVADFYNGTVGASIKSGGSGSGNNGGFDIGDHLAFDGDGSTDGARWMITQPIDTTRLNQIVMRIVTGNGSNGGETPDDSGEGLVLYYKTPQMNDFIPIDYFPTLSSSDFRGGDIGYPDYDTNDMSGYVNNVIIPVGGGEPTLQDYSKYIPTYARGEGTQFLIYQFESSGSGKDNYGIKNISYRRTTPIQVVAPLDDPEASSFIRSAPPGSTPKKRKKDVDDKLTASDEYTTFKFGNEFPGQEVRVGGEDPFKGAKIGDDVEPSPQSKDEVKKSFADFQKGDERVEVIKTPEQIQAENDQYFEDLNNLLAENEYDYTDPQVLEITDKILKNDPKNIDAYYYKSAYYDVSGDIEGARKVVDEMVKNNPDSPDGYALRSFYRQEAGDLAGAIEDLEKTIELEPNSEYVAYMEMELADLKYQEAEVETNNAERNRMESEAGAIEKKAHQDYWDNADLYEIEVPEIEPVEVNNWDKNESRSGILDLYKADYETAKATIANLPKQSETIGATYNGDNIDYVHLSQINKNIENRDVRFRSPESMSQKELQRTLISLSLEIEDQKYWINDLSKKLKLTVTGAPNYALGGTKFTGEINGTTAKDIEAEDDKLQDMLRTGKGDWKAQNLKVNKLAYQRKADSEIKKLNAEQYQLITQYNKLYNAFMGVEGEAPPEQPSTLYDQMKALYDEEDPEKEIKTELNELGFDKQYKDLMSAWDSAEKFSKFITPLKNLSDALLGSKTAQNAKYENYKIAIAKSIMLNKPIRVNPDTIDPILKAKLGSKLKPSMFLDYDLEQFYKENPGPDGYMYPQGSGTGYGLIPIVSEPIPYADQNIYEDEFGRVSVNDGSRENTTFQPFKEYYSWQTGLADIIKGGNPLAGRGQAQYQIVVPSDGTEPYLLYKDHAYHNVKSTDEGEVPFFANKGAAGFVNWLGNTAHNRGDGDANTGGMAGYPPNIRGDVITEFRINATDLPKEVQETIYRHPLVTENPGLVQLLRDKLYTDEYVKTFKYRQSLPTTSQAKTLHSIYNDIILKKADKFKDFITDNVTEITLRGLGMVTGQEEISDIRTASNMLQKYDDYIQQTIYTPDGKAYIPGYTNPNGGVVDDNNRIDITDTFTKNSQNKLQSLMTDNEIQALLKGYVNGKFNKNMLGDFLNTHIGDKGKLGFALSNSLGGGARVDVDQFLNGKLVIKKNYEFRHDDSIDEVGILYDFSHVGGGPGKYRIAKEMAKLFDVSNDAWAHSDNLAISTIASFGTMLAARQLLHPVQSPGMSFQKAMNIAPTMPYKLEFDLPQNIMNILNAEPEDRFVDGEFIPGGWPTPSDLGSAGEIGGVDATSAATAAATTKKKKKPKGKVNESNLYERLKKRPFFNQDDIKPEFPENPPPKLDPKTGMHPEYGKKANRYKKLDPISANSMPPTGDPEIDAVVNKQKTINKIKKMTKKA